MVFKDGRWTDQGVTTTSIEDNYAVCTMNDL